MVPAPTSELDELDDSETPAGQRAGFLPFIAAKALVKAFKKKPKPGEPGVPAAAPQGGSMGFDGDESESMWGTGNDATGDNLGYDADEVEGEQAYGEDMALAAVDSELGDIAGEEDAAGDDCSGEEVGAGRSRKRRLKRLRRHAQQRHNQAKQRGHGKRATKWARRAQKAQSLEQIVSSKQVRREGSAFAQQQAVFAMLDDGGAGGPVFGYEPSQQRIPGFGTRGEINEVPFQLSSGGLEYAEDTFQAGTGVRDSDTAAWVTPQITYADMRLIGVRMTCFVQGDEQGIEMRMSSLFADGDKQAIYATQRSQIKVYNDLGYGTGDMYVRTMRDTQLIEKNTIIHASTAVRQYFDNAAVVVVRTTLTAVLETVRDPRVAGSP